MHDERKTRKQLITELHTLRTRVSELEKGRAGSKPDRALRQESEGKYWNVFEHMPEEVHFWQLVYDESGRIVTWRLVDVTPSAAKSSNHTPAGELKGKTVDEIFGPGTTGRYMPSVRKIMSEGVSHSFEHYIPGLDKHFRFTFVPFGDHFITTITDVTRFKQAEKALRESEEKFRTVFQSSPDPMLIASFEEGRLLDVNEAFLSFTGFPAEECLSRTDVDLALWHSPAERANFRVLFKNRSKLRDFEGRLQTRRGLRTVLLSADTIAIGDGSCIIILIKDISERKRAEETLRETKQRLELAAASGYLGIWDWDISSDVLIWDERMFELYGADADSFPNTLAGWRRALHPDDLGIALEKLEKAVRKEQDYDTAYRVVRPDGTVRTIKSDAIVLSDEQGNATRMIGLNRDITALKEMEAALQEREMLFSRIFHQSPYPVVISRLSDGIYIEVNEPFCMVTGHSREETIGRTAVGLNIWPDPLDRALLIGSLEASGPVHNLETSFRRKSGEVFPTLYSTATIEVRGEPCLISIFVDITERRLAEEEKERLQAQLRQAQKLEAIGTLAEGVAHDFKNILCPIIGYTQMAIDDAPESSPLRSDLEQILSAANRANDLSKQILAVSDHGQEQERVPIDISSITREALKLMRASLPSSIEIRQNIQRGMALADATQIHQVLMNLFTNSVHAIGERGMIAVNLSSVELSEEDLLALSIADLRPGAFLKLSVSDTGHGIDAETMQRIFDPYFTTKDVGKGSGLGLAVVHGIVKRHEGAITVQSSPGAGSIFDVYLPRLDDTGEHCAETASNLPRGTERILLVDNETVVADLIALMLERLGYKVTVRTDALQAIEFFRSCPDCFDLVIADYIMPHITGTELAVEILKTRPGMPIMLCTGYSKKVTEKSAKDLGLRGFILKPPDRKALAELVRSVLDETAGPGCPDRHAQCSPA
ncbi:MAG: PAS domain S-box protein [Desulfobacteraceae bacterium]|nr:PAS domain S-box protein [Desulfobacteraceae bacterium]